MYAVIETGGKQYRVEVGTELQVELLDAEPGTTITLDRVLLVGDGDSSSIGRPLVADAAVSAEVVRRMRGEKLISFKYRPKARSRVKKGHRQELLVLRISDITLAGKSAAKDAAKAEHDAKTERQRLEDAASAQAAKDAALAAKLAVGSDAAEKKPTPATASTAKAGTSSEAKAGTSSEAKAPGDVKAKAAAGKTKTKTKTDTAATAGTRPATETVSGTKPAKRTAKPAGSDATDASTVDAAEAKADAPKRPRATKKDE